MVSARLARLCRLAWVRTSANNGRVRPAVLPCEILPKSQEAASEKLTQTPHPVFGAACEISFAAPRDPRRVAPKSHKQNAPRDVPQGEKSKYSRYFCNDSTTIYCIFFKKIRLYKYNM